MLDTIALMLPEHSFVIKYPDRFTPNATALKGLTGATVLKALYNPTKAEKVSGYKPRLTLFRRPIPGHGMGMSLKVEFSAPKLLLGNNFVELSDKDFEALFNALDKALSDMGIIIRHADLLQAPVSAVHYSKNVLLDHGTPCFLLIQQLGKMDLSAKLDLNESHFRNGGTMAKYHASSYEVALYDKVKDLERGIIYGDKRAAERDYNKQDRDLFGARKPEVLRFEVRLQKAKLKSLLETLKIQRAMTFEGIFCSTLSKTILNHFWRTISAGLYLHEIDARDKASLIQTIKAVFPRKRMAKVSELAFCVLTCQELGVRGAALAMGATPAQMARLKADMKKLAEQGGNPRTSVLNSIREELRLFSPLSLPDLKEAKRVA